MEPAVQRELFEELLIAAVRKHATHIYVYPTSHKETEIIFRLKDRLVRWHVERRTSTEEFVTIIKESFKKAGSFSEDAGSGSGDDDYIQRWVDEHRVGFRVASWLLTNQDNERQADAIRIEVLS